MALWSYKYRLSLGKYRKLTEMVVKTPLSPFQIRLPKLLFLGPDLSIFIKYNVLWIVWLLFDMVWWLFNGSKCWWNKLVFHNFCKQNNNGFIWFISPTFLTIKSVSSACLNNGALVEGATVTCTMGIKWPKGGVSRLNFLSHCLNSESVIRKNPNISEWNCELKPCRMHRCYESKFSLFDNNAK